MPLSLEAIDTLRAECPACAARRVHTDLERTIYHPLAGHGYTKEQGWTHPTAKAAHDREVVDAQLKQAILDENRNRERLKAQA